MSFFEPPEPPAFPEREDEEDFAEPEWLRAPPNILGTPVPLRVLLARTDDVAVSVAHVAAYPMGVSFVLGVTRRRRSDFPDDPFGQFGFHPPARRQGELGDQLRLGVEFADGAKATTLDPTQWADPREEPDRPVLVQGAGGGGMGDWAYDFWVWPLPPPGPFAFVCEWPAERIELTRHEIDASVFREAAEHAEVLWKDDDAGGGTSWRTYGG